MPIDAPPLALRFTLNVGPSLVVELHGKTLTMVQQGFRPGPDETRSVVPLWTAWAEFRRTMDAIDVWHLAETYGIDDEPGDRPLWEIRLEYPDRSIHSTGWAGFPARRGRQVSPVPTKRFTRLVHAMTRLTRSFCPIR